MYRCESNGWALQLAIWPVYHPSNYMDTEQWHKTAEIEEVNL
jgi:hypothetical protein